MVRSEPAVVPLFSVNIFIVAVPPLKFLNFTVVSPKLVLFIETSTNKSMINLIAFIF